MAVSDDEEQKSKTATSKSEWISDDEEEEQPAKPPQAAVGGGSGQRGIGAVGASPGVEPTENAEAGPTTLGPDEIQALKTDFYDKYGTLAEWYDANIVQNQVISGQNFFTGFENAVHHIVDLMLTTIQRIEDSKPNDDQDAKGIQDLKTYIGQIKDSSITVIDNVFGVLESRITDATFLTQAKDLVTKLRRMMDINLH